MKISCLRSFFDWSSDSVQVAGLIALSQYISKPLLECGMRVEMGVSTKSPDMRPDNLIGDTKDNMAELACDGQIACLVLGLSFSFLSLRKLGRLCFSRLGFIAFACICCNSFLGHYCSLLIVSSFYLI